MKLSQVVPLGFAAIVAVLFLNGLIFFLTVSGLTSTASGVMHSYQVQTALQELEEILVDVQLGERGFIMSRSEEFLEPYKEAKTLLDDKFERARYLLKENGEQVRRLDRLESLAEKGIDVLEQNIARVRAGETPSLDNLLDGKRGLEVMRDKINDMLDAESQLLDDRQRAVSTAEKFSVSLALGGTVIGTFIGGLIIVFVSRQVVKPIDEVANVITASSSEIAATVDQQERNSHQQAISVNQTTSTMDELGASSRQAAGQAEEAATGAKQALTLAEGGTRAVGHTLEGMATLQEKVSAIAQAIVRLSLQTSQIANMSSIVGDLASQTNMLALNAAVEAVRAGDRGKGFGVVAAEIRRLADQSKKSAEKINTLVTEIQMAIDSTVAVTDEGTKTVEKGVQLAHQTADAFTGVAEAINQIFANSQKISLTAKQQAIAIQQVADAMNSLNQGAVQTASGISQTKTGIQKLKEAASTLKTVV